MVYGEGPLKSDTSMAHGTSPALSHTASLVSTTSVCMTSPPLNLNDLLLFIAAQSESNNAYFLVIKKGG